MDFDTFIEQAWTNHASTPRGVATRLQEGAALAADESQIAQMANFAHHLLGEHLGEWHAGREFIEGLSSLPAFTPGGISGGAVRRCIASLLLSEASPTDEAAGARVAALPTSDRIRVNAMATANLAERDTARAMRLFDAALRLADAAALPAADPVNRAMAVASNNLASALEEKPQRSGDERELMILAATAARRFWGVAGTWVEAERAEYRLSMTWLQAGDAAKAREHAQACFAIVDANKGPALERFFVHEAMCLVERASGVAVAGSQALARARDAFEALSESDKEWCAETMRKLSA